MKKLNDTRYSITAYHIKLKIREKYYSPNTKDNALKKDQYISNVGLFVDDFVNKIGESSINDEDNYLSIRNSILINRPPLSGCMLSVDFGKSGFYFSTVEENGKKQEFPKTTKIVKYYRIVFLTREDGNCFMVVFRPSNFSCKTAILTEMRKFLDNTNVIVDLQYVSNNSFIEKLYEDMDFISLNYSLVYDEIGSDNADSSKTIKKRYSSVSIDLSNKHSFRFLSWLKDIFFGRSNDSRQLLTTALGDDFNKDELFAVDDESLSTVVQINGMKRTIPIKDILSFYDVDITSMLKFDDNNDPLEESIIDIIVNYVGGIIIEVNQNE